MDWDYRVRKVIRIRLIVRKVRLRVSKVCQCSFCPVCFDLYFLKAVLTFLLFFFLKATVKIMQQMYLTVQSLEASDLQKEFLEITVGFLLVYRHVYNHFTS